MSSLFSVATATAFGGHQARSGGYKIQRSVRLRSSATAYFSRTPAGAGNRKIWTWSAWVKRGSLGAGVLFMGGATLSDTGALNITFYNDQILVQGYVTNFRVTTPVFRDPSAWYHVVIAFDSTQATANNRCLIYINGVVVTAFATNNAFTQNTDYGVNQAALHTIGYQSAAFGSSYLDGYLTEINFIDGQALTPSSFGETDPYTGVWRAKRYTGSYGTNGFYLNFSDNSAATAAAIGKDYSGNGNDWTPNNISVTAGATYDSMLDVPTRWADGGNGRGNYAVLNPLDKNTSATVADGNLKVTSGAAANYAVRSTIQLPSTGKWYAELIALQLPSASNDVAFGVCTQTATLALASANTWMAYLSGTQGVYNQTTQNTTSAWSALANGDVLQVAYDADNNQVWFGKNNVWLSSTFTNTGNPSAGTDPTITGLSSGLFFIANAYNGSGAASFGQQPFTYTPPSGFKALNTLNLP